MATTQKKTASGSTRKSGTSSRSQSSSGSRGTAGRGGSSNRNRAPEPKPIRREVGALVCLLLGIFTALGYFNMKGFVIDYLCGFMKSLIGYGYWLLPPALFGSAVILGFHRGRPSACGYGVRCCFRSFLVGCSICFWPKGNTYGLWIFSNSFGLRGELFPPAAYCPGCWPRGLSSGLIKSVQASFFF